LVEKLIYDVGMNNGDDTAYYLHKGFSVVAIEADPALANKASERFGREIADGRLKILNLAIAKEAGVLPFWICETRPDFSSLDRENARRNGLPHHRIEVQCCRIDSIIEQHGIPYYMKIDIEGADMDCLDSLKTGHTPKYISVEARGTDAIPRLRDLGYSGFKGVSQLYFFPIDLNYCPEEAEFQRLSHWMYGRNPLLKAARRLGAWRPILSRMNAARERMLRHRKLDGWSFGEASSGPFGEETPGRWQSFEEICECCRHYQQLSAERRPSLFWNPEDGGLWMDFHARRDG
jgi:FkbM family methyltransferase